jgi:hypothetical protein
MLACMVTHITQPYYFPLYRELSYLASITRKETSNKPDPKILIYTHSERHSWPVRINSRDYKNPVI